MQQVHGLPHKVGDNAKRMRGRCHIYLCAAAVFFQSPLSITTGRRRRRCPFLKAPRLGIHPILGGFQNGSFCLGCDMRGRQSRQESCRAYPTKGFVKSLSQKMCIDGVDVIQSASIVFITKRSCFPLRWDLRSEFRNLKKCITVGIHKGQVLHLHFRWKGSTLRRWNFKAQQSSPIR